MGGSIQRLEVLFVGAIMLVAGLVVAVLLFVRPPPQPTYTQATAVPVSALGATPAPAAPTAEPAAAVPTAAPQPTAALSEMAPPPAAASAAVPAVVMAAWPFLLLGVGVVGLGLTGGRIVRRRRMAYTGQSVGMLLDTADAATREANLRVMRDLHDQGHLTPELAAAAGIATGKRGLQLPSLRLPRMTLPTVRMPKLTLPARPARPAPSLEVPTIVRAAPPVTPAAAADQPIPPVALGELPLRPSAEPQPVTAQPTAPGAAGLGGVVVEEIAQRSMRDEELGSLLAAQEIALPEVAIPTTGPGDLEASWSAEDRALVVAATLAEVWAAERFVSPVLAFDTALVAGSAQVVVTIDAVPDEDERLASITDRLAVLRPTWRSRWKPAQQQTATLTIDVNTSGALPGAGGPIIAPVLHHGRGNKVARYFPLGTWRHLGLYGGEALGALHALLTGILYTQPPAAVALTICDAGQISPLYRGVTHRVEAPGDVRATCEALGRSLRRGGASRADVRPLLLVVIEPDAEALAALTTLLARVRQQPSAPIHLLIVQERLSPAGRDLYAMLPALITSGGQGSASWLPGQQSEWPRRDAARLVGRGMRVEGRAATQTEAEAADLLAPLRRTAAVLPPVLWEAPTVPEPVVPVVEAEATLADAIVETQPGPLVRAEAAAEPAPVVELVAVLSQTPPEDVPVVELAEPPSARSEGVGEETAGSAVAADDGYPVANDTPADQPALTAEAQGREADCVVVEPPAVDETEVPARDDGSAEPPVDFAIDAADTAELAAQAEVRDTPPASSEPALEVAEVVLPAPPAPRADPVPAEPETQARGEDATAAPAPSEVLPGSTPSPAAVQENPTLLADLAWLNSDDVDLRVVGVRTGKPSTAPAPAPDEPDNGWPLGPQGMRRSMVERLVAGLLSDPEITAKPQEDQRGLTKNRVSRVGQACGAFPAEQAKPLAEVCMVWFDLAGTLAPPTKPKEHPLNQPRPMVVTDPAQIAERLRATPIPDADTVRAAFAQPGGAPR